MLIKIIKKVGLFFVLGLCAVPLVGNEVRAAHVIERRLVFDVGSGNTKAQLSDFDVTDNRIVKTVAVWKEKVLYKADLELGKDGKFSEEIMEKGLAAFERILQKAKVYHPDKSYGVATAAYREALNGQEMCDRIFKQLGLRIQIAPQDLEARLGFLTASSLFQEFDQSDLISWDIGGGSFQISGLEDGVLRVWKGDFAKVGMGLLVMKEVQGKALRRGLAINPVSLSEAQRAQAVLESKYAQEVPTWLLEKMKNPKTRIVGLGAMHGELVRALGKQAYLFEESWGMVEKHAGESDQELRSYASSPEFVIPNFVYLHTFMKLMGAQEVTRGETGGNMSGVLLCKELWK